MVLTESRRDALRGAVLMTCSSVVFAVMSALIAALPEVDSYKKALFRFATGLGVLGIAALSGRIGLVFNNSRLLLLRGLLGGVSVFLFYLSIDKLGVGKGTVISYAYPVFATLFGAIVLKEPLDFLRALAIAVAMVGIYLLATTGKNEITDWRSLGLYEALAILGAILSGGAIVVVKKLHSTDNSYAIFFAQCTVGLWLVMVPANAAPVELTYSRGMLLVAIGLTAAGGQLLMTQSFRHSTVFAGSLLSMLVPVFNIIIGLAIFREPLTQRGLLGAGIVLASCVIVIVKR